ncbi:RNA polymerase recycling motor HelD [Niameybacter massiliensis]|uniref:RNA polymerase recycling motor HelD n=1 Tax=Niameybacter massiliensis TaxID=1658108 RepID=UPI0006B44D67|nr:RNA polymerase recycling motor HelD [Niameybacter massiliensis]
MLDSIILEQEKAYLKQTIDFLKQEIHKGLEGVDKQKATLLGIRKEMWEEGMHAIDEFDQAIDMSQYVNMEAIETSQYKHQLEKVMNYQKMLPAPYFGRFDFKEDGESEEKVYIGYHNAMNDDTYEVLVYDWRTPIAGLFYNHEVGPASYVAPCGEIEGEMLLKRQYEVEKGELKFFFDSSIAITDDMLKQTLGQNTSRQMRNIVETIQKEQNRIIRDEENDVLIVQGAAGSGKTSIALHRIAFLLYNQREKGLTNKDVMILSPNSLFGDYIAEVLPELGEQNVECATLEDLFEAYFGNYLRMGKKHSQLEAIISSKNRDRIRASIAFKGSEAFMTMLERYIEWIEKEGIIFKDVYYREEKIMGAKELKTQFLDNQINMSIIKRLKRIEKILLERIKPLEKAYYKELVDKLENDSKFAHDEQEEARRLVQEEYDCFMSTITRFTRVNVLKVYERLMRKQKLFNQFAEGIVLPEGIEGMMKHTAKCLEQKQVAYEDGAVLLYLKLRLEGESLYASIKQVLIDEAQDYYPIHYKIFKMIFRNGQYTILGDYCQAIEKPIQASIYDGIMEILKPRKGLQIDLLKSYRSTYEICEFAGKLRGSTQQVIPFERHGEAPRLIEASSEQALISDMKQTLACYFEEGYKHIAILCKTRKEAHYLQEIFKDEENKNGKLIISPIFEAKGLEYDAVMVYQTNKDHYCNNFDKQLLYIAATRALHTLSFYYTGEVSSYLI